MGRRWALRGLINENLREVVTKFPGLGSVPVLGALFRSQQFRKGETELVILVTPRLAKPLPGNGAAAHRQLRRAHGRGVLLAPAHRRRRRKKKRGDNREQTHRRHRPHCPSAQPAPASCRADYRKSVNEMIQGRPRIPRRSRIRVSAVVTGADPDMVNVAIETMRGHVAKPDDVQRDIVLKVGGE